MILGPFLASTVDTESRAARVTTKNEIKSLRYMTSSFGSAILRIVYGIQLSEQNEEYVHVSEEILDGLAKTGILNTFYVDTLPFRKKCHRNFFLL